MYVLKQRYIIQGQIGQGGYGAVYRATDTQFRGRTVAIKEMSQNHLRQPALQHATEAFYQEALMLASLSHPNIPRIYEQFTTNGRFYLVMDYIEGQTLEELLQHNQGRLSLERILHLGIQLCDVLDYLHRHNPPIIFRDLKPANIMIATSGQTYLIDFGIARHFKRGQTRDTTTLGSSGYAPPEQYGKAQTTTRTDIYSLGATLHQLLTGRDPANDLFHFSPIVLPHPALAGLDTLVLSMVSVESEKRPSSAGFIKQELLRITAQYQMIQAQQAQRTNTMPSHSKRPSISAPPTPVPPLHNTTHNARQHVPPSDMHVNRGVQQHMRQTPTTLYTCKGHTGRVTSVCWSPDGTRLATGSYDKTVRLWDARTGQHLLTYGSHRDAVTTLAWSPGNVHITSASNDGMVHLWDARTGGYLASYGGHIGAVNTLSWSPVVMGNELSRLIASAGADRIVHIWNASTSSGQNVFSFRNHTSSIRCVAWSPDGQHIASCGDDQRVLLWSPKEEYISPSKHSILTPTTNTSPHSVIRFTGHEARINALSWSPDSRYIASASSDYRVLIHDCLNEHTLISYTIQSKGMKNCVAWSPDGKYLAVGGNNKCVELWDFSTGKQVFLYHGHDGYITTLAWSPDGTRIASASVDQTVHVWKAI